MLCVLTWPPWLQDGIRTPCIYYELNANVHAVWCYIILTLINDPNPLPPPTYPSSIEWFFVVSFLLQTNLDYVVL